MEKTIRLVIALLGGGGGEGAKVTLERFFKLLEAFIPSFINDKFPLSGRKAKTKLA